MKKRPILSRFNTRVSSYYDANGNLTNLVYPGGRNVYYAYDSLNRLTNVTDWANRKTSFEYDLASRLRKIIRPNGTVCELSYDAAGQLTNIVERTANGNVIVLFKLNWDNAGRVNWEFAAPLPHDYTPPQRVMTYDEDNRLLTVNGQSVTNDADGNLIWGPLPNGQFTSLTYDVRNRLIAVGGTGSTPALGYGYDPAGNRIAMTNLSNGQVTRYVVNPNARLSQVLMRIRPGVTNYYVYGLGLLYEVTETANSTNLLFYHYDLRGSTVALTDSGGNVTDRIGYSAYGLMTYRTGTNDTPFLFNGRYGVQIDPNGLLYMRARYYNPYICRFLNPDPIGFAGGFNFYAYADGNPVSLIDPFGLMSWSDVGDYFHDVGQVFMGYGDAIADTAVGLYNVVRHPVDTATGLYNVAMHPVQAYNAISQGISDTWNSGPRGQGRIVGHILITVATFGATKATSVVGTTRRVGETVTVSRWGRPGLKAGDWVMKGPATKKNYILSGKWDPFPWNRPAPFEEGAEFVVPASSVRWPTGIGLEGRVKGLLGQRIYAPDGMGLLHWNEAVAITGARVVGGLK